MYIYLQVNCYSRTNSVQAVFTLAMSWHGETCDVIDSRWQTRRLTIDIVTCLCLYLAKDPRLQYIPSNIHTVWLCGFCCSFIICYQEIHMIYLPILSRLIHFVRAIVWQSQCQRSNSSTTDAQKPNTMRTEYIFRGYPAKRALSAMRKHGG